MVGRAQRAQPVWFTISHGIVNEIYYPRVDQVYVRDLGLIVDGDTFFAEVKRDCQRSSNVSKTGFLPA